MITRWQPRETDANLPLMAETLGISEITANVMANRGIRSKNAAVFFLAPSITRLRDFLLMKGAAEALERVSAAISCGEKITIFGDYDADGITSTTILFKTLRRFGAVCEYYMPHRIKEGYGLNYAVVEKLAHSGTKLLITVDNGISAVEEIKAATAFGMDTVVIDHHEPGEILPQAVAIIDPKQPDCDYPFKEMCAAGLSFKFAEALCRRQNHILSSAEAGNPLAHTDTEKRFLDEMLALSAIGTLCDIVDLADENRIIVNSGLAVLNENKLINPGLGSLITIRGYLDKAIDTFTVGFVIGPCLNATGRLESAALAVDLLLCGADEPEKRVTLAQKLAEINEARKTLTAECVERALAVLNKENEENGNEPQKVLVLTDFEAHESVAGIVAGRIRESTGHPTILLTKGDDSIKGSGRSIESYNLFEALYKHRRLFTRFGGHAMAAGFSLPEENVPLLRAALNEDCTLTDDDFLPILHTDREILPEEITLSLSDELSRLAPFGKGNGEPIFVCRNMFVEKVRVIDEKNTLIFTISDKKNRRLKGIAFGLNEKFAAKNSGFTMDAAFTIETNEWNNNVEVQIKIRDFRINPSISMV
ncbi:MAG: single-stranded-DNA-specific exonuclease RecJ [Defluviitaleaceae bacterium]|nr:single-stranded-DNA-specific exonuclease RecJ [Defluviitaleaceae bacterium]